MTKLQDYLLDYRAKHRITQVQLAERLNVKRAALSKWEIGHAVPSTEILIRISKLLEVPVEALVGMEEFEKKAQPIVLEPEVVKFAFYQQHGVVNEDQKKLIEDFIKMVTKSAQ